MTRVLGLARSPLVRPTLVILAALLIGLFLSDFQKVTFLSLIHI